MTFCKMLKNDKVVNIGCVFLKWNIKRHRMNVCSVDEGQFVQSYDEKTIYKDSWLKPAPEEAKNFEEAKIVVIDQIEFDDLKELLNEGEEVLVEKPEPLPSPQVLTEEPVEEKPMSIAEMRQIIAEQQKQIDLLLEKFNS